MWSDYLPYILLTAAFVALVVSMYWLIGWMSNADIVDKTKDAIMKKAASSEAARAHITRDLVLREGKQEKQSFATKFDLLIRQSGIKSKFHFINVELFVCLMVLCAALAGAAGWILTYRIATTLLAALVPPALMLLVLVQRANRNYKQTEEDLIPFLDIAANFAVTEDDLISIFERVSPYLGEPLHGALLDCCTSARTTGNMYQALDELTATIGHEQFNIIIQNLSICTRYTNNIAAVLKDCRIAMAEYNAAKKARHSLTASARVDFASIIIMGAFVVYLISGFVEGVSVFELMVTTLPGIIICICCVAVLLFALKVLTSTDKGRR